jgi:hypothetical protein
MNKENVSTRIVHGFMALLVLMVTGCTHPMNISNLSSYYTNSHVSLPQRLRIGVKSECYAMEGRRLTKMVADSLGKYNTQVTTLGSGSADEVDVVATMSVRSNYEGSGWNFLVNFPGFLIFAPAWHGYNYEVTHMIDVTLQDARTGQNIGAVSLPVVLEIQHADINRTWTECSWFEVGIIAFVGGIAFVQYDETITPQVTQKAGPVLADYIAQEVVNDLRNYNKPHAEVVTKSSIGESGAVETGGVAEKLRALNTLKEQNLLTEEEYTAKRSQLIDTM